MTKVVNVKVANIRPKYHDLKEWCEDPKNVYIARQGIVFINGKRYPPKGSKFANPYKVGKGGVTRENSIEMYRNYIKEKIDSGEITQKDLEELRGKNLGCWCKPAACHGDVLLELLNEKQAPRIEEINEDGYLIGEDGYVVISFITSRG